MIETPFAFFGAVMLAAISAALAYALILLLHPLLRRYAMARPNARSSHRTPTPQGGGIAVVSATIATSAIAIAVAVNENCWPLSLLLIATIVIAAVGVLDDMRNLPVLPRLLLQALCVCLVIAALPVDMRLLPILPWWAERALFVIAGVWFVNLVNFMDGIDWIIVAKIVPITAALAVAGMAGAIPTEVAMVAIALGGSVVGFAPFNRPVAKLFLGDVGSLPIGLLTGWLLAMLAGSGHLTAAILLPLYYCADATITLMRRLARGESVTSAHRTHFYQRATDAGYTVPQIVTRIFAVNVALAGLAGVTIFSVDLRTHAAATLLGALLVGWLLFAFSRRTTKPMRGRRRR